MTVSGGLAQEDSGGGSVGLAGRFWYNTGGAVLFFCRRRRQPERTFGTVLAERVESFLALSCVLSCCAFIFLGFLN